jgi:hypothetical protein
MVSNTFISKYKSHKQFILTYKGNWHVGLLFFPLKEIFHPAGIRTQIFCSSGTCVDHYLGHATKSATFLSWSRGLEMGVFFACESFSCGFESHHYTQWSGSRLNNIINRSQIWYLKYLLFKGFKVVVILYWLKHSVMISQTNKKSKYKNLRTNVI